MTIRIHGIATSRALRPLWAALELGVPFEHVPVPYRGGATRTPEFLALNPNGRVPVLVDARGDEPVVVWESMACVLYLARTAGAADGRGIAPSTPAEEGEALRWSFWAMTELERDALTVLMHRMTMPAAERRPELADQAGKRLRAPLGVLEAQLGARASHGHAWLAGDRFTVADLCVASVAYWLRPAPALLDPHPRVRGWLDACLDRPAWRAANALGQG
ncbi:MAG: Disulfide-bond oxidoreductase YfcG [Pseudomonadota bacterium]